MIQRRIPNRRKASTKATKKTYEKSQNRGYIIIHNGKKDSEMSNFAKLYTPFLRENQHLPSPQLGNTIPHFLECKMTISPITISKAFIHERHKRH